MAGHEEVPANKLHAVELRQMSDRHRSCTAHALARTVAGP